MRMKSSVHLISLAVVVFLAGMTANSAMAQSAKVTVLVDNDKVRAYEVSMKPGDENKAVPSANSRVVRVLKAGTIARNYADGKTEKVEWKTGEVKFLQGEKTAYVAKNVGKTELQLYVVMLK